MCGKEGGGGGSAWMRAIGKQWSGQHIPCNRSRSYGFLVVVAAPFSLLASCNGGISVILYSYLRTCHISFSFPIYRWVPRRRGATLYWRVENCFAAWIISSGGSTRRCNSFLCLRCNALRTLASHFCFLTYKRSLDDIYLRCTSVRTCMQLQRHCSVKI